MPLKNSESESIQQVDPQNNLFNKTIEARFDNPNSLKLNLLTLIMLE